MFRNAQTKDKCLGTHSCLLHQPNKSVGGDFDAETERNHLGGVLDVKAEGNYLG